MRTTFCVITAMMLLSPPKAHALFGHVAVERDKRIATEQQLAQERQLLDAQRRTTIEQQQRVNRWQITAFILGVSTFVMLIIGTAIGSKGRHDAVARK